MNKAKELLETIDGMGGLQSYRASNNQQYAWNAAFVLYQREHPKSKMRRGCGSCMTQVYNWLKSCA